MAQDFFHKDNQEYQHVFVATTNMVRVFSETIAVKFLDDRMEFFHGFSSLHYNPRHPKQHPKHRSYHTYNTFSGGIWISRVSRCQPLHTVQRVFFLMPRKELMPVHGNFSDEIKTDTWHKIGEGFAELLGINRHILR